MHKLVPRDIFITAMLLGSFAAVGVFLVASIHQATSARIEENRQAVIRQQITELLLGIEYDNDPVNDQIRIDEPRLGGKDLAIWFAREQERVVGIVLTSIAPDGYSGDIHLLVGMDAQGTILGVRVTRHRETPGLGDDIEVNRSNWIHQFRGLSLDNPPLEQWRVRRDGGVFDQFTGATITPRAVVGAVSRTLLWFRDESTTLLATPPTEKSLDNAP